MKLFRPVCLTTLLLITSAAIAQTTRIVDGKLEVRGVVTTVDDRKPIVNATVEWTERRYRPQSLTFAGVDVIGATKSDDKGHFVLSVPVPRVGAPIFVRATADGYAYRSMMYHNMPGEEHRFGMFDTAETDDGVWLALEKEAIASGVVVDENDQPIAGAEVYDMQTDPVRTDAAGHFELRKRFVIDSSRVSRTFVVRHPNYVEREYQQTSKEAAEGAETRIKLDRGVLISGKVTDAENGEPVFGAGVTAGDTNRRARGTKSYAYTSADGTYRLRVPSGKYELSCFFYGDKSDFNQQTYVPSEAPQPLDATTAEEITEDLKLDRAARVNGFLVGVKPSADDVLIAMLRPAVEHGDRPPNELTSPVFPDGSFHIFPVPLGKYELILARQSPMVREPQTLVTKPLEISNAKPMSGVEITLKELPPDPDAGAAVSGRVLMPDGTPASRAQILALATDTPTGNVRESIRADKDGRFKMRQLAVGREYILRAWDAKQENAYTVKIQIQPGESWSKDITLKKGSILKGVAKKSTGEPLAGADVMLGVAFTQGRGKTVMSIQITRTNDKGEYELRGFLYTDEGPKLTLSLSPRVVFAPGATPGVIAVESNHEDLKVEPGETLDGLDFIFTDGRRAKLEAVRREKE